MKKLFSTLISTALVLSIFNFAQANAATKARAASPSMQRRPSGLRFNERKIREANRSRRYSIKAVYPYFIGARDERITRLNAAINRRVAEQVADFRKDFKEPMKRMGPTGSSFDLSYSAELATNDLVSILFYMDTFHEGAAHPLHFTVAFNYNLNAGKTISLADLFKPNSGYLNLISKYSIDDLKKQLGPDPDTEWIERGAGPSKDNFKSWTVSREGLKIMFDQYLVASYADGPHEVVIPFSILRNAIDPAGPLSEIQN